MNYSSVCDYIIANGAIVDDSKFRLNEADGIIYVDKWKYDFKKPNERNITEMVTDDLKNSESYKDCLKQNEDKRKADLMEEFKKWKYYDALISLIKEMNA